MQYKNDRNHQSRIQSNMNWLMLIYSSVHPTKTTDKINPFFPFRQLQAKTLSQHKSSCCNLKYCKIRYHVDICLRICENVTIIYEIYGITETPMIEMIKP